MIAIFLKEKLNIFAWDYRSQTKVAKLNAAISWFMFCEVCQGRQPYEKSFLIDKKAGHMQNKL